MLLPLRDVERLFRCPTLGRPLLRRDSFFQSENGGRIYPIVAGKPALFDFQRSIISEKDLVARAGASTIQRSDTLLKAFIRKRLFQPRGQWSWLEGMLNHFWCECSAQKKIRSGY